MVFAGTRGGVYRSDDKGDTWHSVSRGMTVLEVSKLAVGKGEQVLFAKTPAGLFRSDDKGHTWQPTFTTLEETNAASLSPKLSLLRWDTHQVPQAAAVSGDQAIVYASAGAAMMFRANIRLPLIWHAPTPYLEMVSFYVAGVRVGRVLMQFHFQSVWRWHWRSCSRSTSTPGSRVPTGCRCTRSFGCCPVRATWWLPLAIKATPNAGPSAIPWSAWRC